MVGLPRVLDEIGRRAKCDGFWTILRGFSQNPLGLTQTDWCPCSRIGPTSRKWVRASLDASEKSVFSKISPKMAICKVETGI